MRSKPQKIKSLIIWLKILQFVYKPVDFNSKVGWQNTWNNPCLQICLSVKALRAIITSNLTSMRRNKPCVIKPCRSFLTSQYGYRNNTSGRFYHLFQKELQDQIAQTTKSNLGWQNTFSKSQVNHLWIWSNICLVIVCMNLIAGKVFVCLKQS